MSSAGVTSFFHFRDLAFSQSLLDRLACIKAATAAAAQSTSNKRWAAEATEALMGGT